jgi:NADPH:quinone reductase-like Zn-dependent oxidoreductase
VVHGGKFTEKGSFAEYLVTPENVTFATPKAVEDAEAATYGIGFGTAAMVSNPRSTTQVAMKS